MYQLVFPNGVTLRVPDAEAARAMSDPETSAAMTRVQTELAKARGSGAFDCATILPLILQILGPVIAKCLTPQPTPSNGGDVCP